MIRTHSGFGSVFLALAVVGGLLWVMAARIPGDLTLDAGNATLQNTSAVVVGADLAALAAAFEAEFGVDPNTLVITDEDRAAAAALLAEIGAVEFAVTGEITIPGLGRVQTGSHAERRHPGDCDIARELFAKFGGKWFKCTDGRLRGFVKMRHAISPSKQAALMVVEGSMEVTSYLVSYAVAWATIIADACLGGGPGGAALAGG